jgi:hypothetical protein
VALWWPKRFHVVANEPLGLLVVAIDVGYSRRGWPILPCARTRTPKAVCNVSVRLSHRTAKEFEDPFSKAAPTSLGEPLENIADDRRSSVLLLKQWHR